MVMRSLAFLTAVAILLGSATVHGMLARDSDQLDMAVARVAAVPMEVGEWQGIDVPQNEKDTQAFAQTGAKSYWVRSYVNQRTNEAVLAILMCGRSGRMAVHTPEVCYHGAGFELAAQPVEWSSPAEGRERADHRLWTGLFVRKASPPTSLRLFWAWSAGDVWTAPVNPRWQFRGEPFLYKLYVSHDVSEQQNGDLRGDAAADLLAQLLPELDRTLFPDRMRQGRSAP